MFFFTLTHTNYLSRRRQHFTLSSLAFFSSSFSFPYSSPWLSSQRQQPFTLSFLAIFSKAATFFSLLLGYLFESGNTLLSPPCLSLKRKSLSLSLSLSLHREDPWAKAIKFIVTLSIYKTLFNSLLDKEYITSLIRDRLFFHTNE